MSEKLKEHEELNDKLQKEIGVAAEQLRKNGIELQRRRTEINVNYFQHFYLLFFHN